MEDNIKGARLNFTCNQNWDHMEADNEGRFCASCQKTVYDMTDKKAAYFIQLMQEQKQNNTGFCGRFTVDQLQPSTMQQKSYWKKWAIAAMVFIGFGTFGQKANGQTIRMGKVASKPAQAEADREIYTMLGDVEIVDNPELRNLHKYVASQFKSKNTLTGRMVVSFKINKEGNLTDLQLSRHLPETVNDEILRILKRAPKWHKDNIAQGYPFSLFLSFEKGKIKPYVS